MEIERKFLVVEPPGDFGRFPASRIAQGYLADTPGCVRLRSRDEKTFFLTVKQGQGLVREEAEIEISRDQFDALWPLTAGRRLRKTRYKIPFGPHCIELDTFHGARTGLIMAEVEFSSEEEAAGFTAPEWFGEEVTDQPGYTNRALAVE